MTRKGTITKVAATRENVRLTLLKVHELKVSLMNMPNECKPRDIKMWRELLTELDTVENALLASMRDLDKAKSVLEAGA